jgi:hypothetical protein
MVYRPIGLFRFQTHLNKCFWNSFSRRAIVSLTATSRTSFNGNLKSWSETVVLYYKHEQA